MGIVGFVIFGDYVVIGGKVGVVDYISVIFRVCIVVKSGVMLNIDIFGDYVGFFVVLVGEWWK